MSTPSGTSLRASMLGSTIAINGTDIRLKVHEVDTSLMVEEREVTHADDTDAAQSDRDPVYVFANHVHGLIRFQASWHGVDPSGLLTVMRDGSKLDVTVYQGGSRRFSAKLGLLRVNNRVGRRRRHVGLGVLGRLSGQITESN